MSVSNSVSGSMVFELGLHVRYICLVYDVLGLAGDFVIAHVLYSGLSYGRWR